MALLRVFAVALLPGVAALRRAHSDGEYPKAYRQELGNMQDMQYYGKMTIGGQHLKAILDTGSFELLVFSRSCRDCGLVAVYNEKASPTFRWGGVTTRHSFSSGGCKATDGYDTVTVDGVPVAARSQPLWVATDCEIPQLGTASFNAIVGLGPPGQPASKAQSELKHLEESEKSFRSTHKFEAIPSELIAQKREASKVLEAAKTKHELLDSMGVKTFSACLGRYPRSPGYLIWNDETRKGKPGVKQIPVAGVTTWSISVKGMKFLGLPTSPHDVEVGCAGGCGAVVDTGTSLLGVPTPIYDAIAKLIRGFDHELDCTDLSRFPDITLDVGSGQPLQLPPSAYLGSYVGQMSPKVEQFVRTEKMGRGRAPCQLLLMDLGPVQHTFLGPTIVLGMPFFREYYTTFDLSGGRGHRSIFISPASQTCEPEPDKPLANLRLASVGRFWSSRYTPREVDVSALRVPTWFERSNDTGVRGL